MYLKKTIIIVVLFYFLYLNIGYFPIFLIKQRIIKNEMALKIKHLNPAAEITELIFDNTSISKLKWLDKKEFIYDEKMYDVVKIRYNNDKIHIFCLEDVKEKMLFAQLKKMKTSAENKKENNESSLFKLFIKDYLSEKNTSVIKLFSKSYIFIDKINHYTSCFPENLSPPPEFGSKA